MKYVGNFIEFTDFVAAMHTRIVTCQSNWQLPVISNENIGYEVLRTGIPRQTVESAFVFVGYSWSMLVHVMSYDGRVYWHFVSVQCKIYLCYCSLSICVLNAGGYTVSLDNIGLKGCIIYHFLLVDQMSL